MSNYTPGEPIENAEKLTVSLTMFENLTAEDSGAAIINSYTGTMSLVDTIFTGNSAESMGGAIYNEGVMTFTQGVAFTGNSAQYGGAIISSSYEEDASITITNGQFTGNSAELGGAIYNAGTLILNDVDFTQNTGDGDGGAIYHEFGTATLKNVTFTDNSAMNDGGAISNCATLSITDAVFSGNSAMAGGAIYNEEDGEMTLTNVSFLTATDSIYNLGDMKWSGAITLAATVTTQSTIKASNVKLTFDVSSYNRANSTAFVDYSLLSGLGTLAAVVNGKQATGAYALASSASSCNKSVTLKDTDGNTLATLAIGNTFTQGKRSYTLTRTADKALELVVDGVLLGDEQGIAWASVANADQYEVQFSRDNFATVLAFTTSAVGVDTAALAAGDYQWRIRAKGAKNWTNGNDFAASAPETAARILESNNDGDTDLFFAQASGTWSRDFAAKHVGTATTAATGEKVRLEGKNSFANLFQGSEDASLLCLTDDEQGDAIFFDDVYSALPEDTDATGRIQKIREIRAGDGDDVIDMTSQNFQRDAFGMTLRGGDGDDVIWAGDGDNMLFGDDGDDRLTGSSGNDVLAGGSGNDSITCAGGSDIVCFGGAWGTDTVLQTAGGTVTLWFATGSSKKWNAATMTYTDGKNSVTVSGIDAADVSLKFGDDSSETYDRLAASGAFEAFTTDCIFGKAGTTGCLA